MDEAAASDEPRSDEVSGDITGVGTPVGLGPDHCEVLIGASSTYGHVVRFDAMGFDPTDLDVSWEVDSARLTYGSGHQVFVPAEAFLFGR